MARRCAEGRDGHDHWSLPSLTPGYDSCSTRLRSRTACWSFSHAYALLTLACEGGYMGILEAARCAPIKFLQAATSKCSATRLLDEGSKQRTHRLGERRSVTQQAHTFAYSLTLQVVLVYRYRRWKRGRSAPLCLSHADTNGVLHAPAASVMAFGRAARGRPARRALTRSPCRHLRRRGT